MYGKALNMITDISLHKPVIIVAGNTDYVKAIVQTLQLSLALPVINDDNCYWITKQQQRSSIELLLCPYGCDSKYCPISQDSFKNKIRRVAFYNVPNDYIALQLLQKGAVGAFYQNDPINVIGKGTKIILKNELWFKRSTISSYFFLSIEQPPSLHQINELPQLSSILTKREMEVLVLMVSGLKNVEVADKLFISLHTVKSHVCHIFKKLGARNRIEVVRLIATSYSNPMPQILDR